MQKIAKSSNKQGQYPQQQRFSKLRFLSNGKLSPDSGPTSYKFGSSANFEKELNKIRNNFELRKSDSIFDKLTDFFQPISRMMMNSWR